MNAFGVDDDRYEIAKASWKGEPGDKRNTKYAAAMAAGGVLPGGVGYGIYRQTKYGKKQRNENIKAFKAEKAEVSKAKKNKTPKPSVKTGLQMVADTKGTVPWGGKSPSLPKTDVKANMGEWSAMRPKTAAPTPFPKGKVAAGVAAGTALAGGAGYLGYKKTISKGMGKDITGGTKKGKGYGPDVLARIKGASKKVDNTSAETS